MPYVYITENKINNKKYIGVVASKNHNRKKNYLGSGVVLKLAIEKYGIENFHKKIIKYFDDGNDAREYEKTLIEELNAIESTEYYNICTGGYGGGVKGHVVSEDTRDKISKSLSGRKRHKDVVERVSEKLRGKSQKEEHIKKRSDSIKKYYKSTDRENLEKRWEKISRSHKGRIKPDIVKEKISKTLSKLSDEEVVQIMEMIENKIPYKEISKKFNISPAQITSIKQKKTYQWLWD